MTTLARVGGFVVALAAVFAVALALGRGVGPTEDPAPVAHHTHGNDGRSEALPARTAGEAAVPGGLMVSQNRYTLTLADPRATPGQDVPVTFTITGPDGRPVTSYDVAHEKRLHLVAVRRDLTGFQHVHPELSKDGVWSTDLDLTAGQWRLFADFRATGADDLTLGADLAVAGPYEPASRPAPSRTAEIDGYRVTLDGGLTAGEDARLTLSVAHDGEPVIDLQPYLGAYGHLVALRDGDLAYLHVHPDGTPGDARTSPGPDVVFHAAVPSAGSYHLYLDFKHQGQVRTAAFTVIAGAASATSAAEPANGHEH